MKLVSSAKALVQAVTKGPRPARPAQAGARCDINRHCSVPISFSQAAMGAEIVIPTLDGGEHKLKIQEGTQSGTTFRIRGKGVPGLQSSGKGDMYVKVRVETPRKLTKRQRELLGEL